MQVQTTQKAMGTRVLPGSERARWGGFCGMVAAPLWVGVVVALTIAEYGFLTRAGWSFLGQNRIPYPSYTARGPYGFVQTANFAVTGLLVMAFVAGLAPLLRRWTGMLARGLLLVAAAAITTSAFTTDKVPGPTTWHGTIHGVSFFVVVLASTFGLLFAGLSLRKTAGWRGWGTATAVMAGWQALMFTVGGGLLPGDVGFYVFVVGLFGWIGATGRRLVAASATWS